MGAIYFMNRAPGKVPVDFKIHWRPFFLYRYDQIIKPGYERVYTQRGMRSQKDYNQRGNLIVKFIIRFPDSLTPEQREALTQILPDWVPCTLVTWHLSHVISGSCGHSLTVYRVQNVRLGCFQGDMGRFCAVFCNENAEKGLMYRGYMNRCIEGFVFWWVVHYREYDGS